MQFADLELAKALQALGYNGDYTHWWVEDARCAPRLEVLPESNPNYADDTSVYAAPRLDDVAYWMEECFGIIIEVSVNEFHSYSKKVAEEMYIDNNISWKYSLIDIEQYKHIGGMIYYNARIDALKAGIVEAINAVRITS